MLEVLSSSSLERERGERGENGVLALMLCNVYNGLARVRHATT